MKNGSGKDDQEKLSRDQDKLKKIEKVKRGLDSVRKEVI
jgi:hypothetical protein